MKALLFLYLLLSGVAYAENKPAPRAAPIDPNEWIKDPDPEPRWISPPLIQRKNDWTKVGTRVPGLSVQQICKRGFVFRYETTSVDGKQYRWVFEFTKTDVPFPVILDLPKEPYQEELNAASTAVTAEAVTAYAWMREKAKALMSSPAETSIPTSPTEANRLITLNPWKQTPDTDTATGVAKNDRQQTPEVVPPFKPVATPNVSREEERR
jgi:hypothetical protein